LASAESCKRALEFSVPPEEVEAETSRVVADVQKRAKLPGFRPGKAPVSLIRRQFEQDIRQSVLENLVPKHIRKRFEEDNLQVIGTPDITDVHFHKGEPLRFKAEFEVVPDIELGDYQGLSVPYHEPVVTDEDIAKRLDDYFGKGCEPLRAFRRALMRRDEPHLLAISASVNRLGKSCNFLLGRLQVSKPELRIARKADPHRFVRAPFGLRRTRWTSGSIAHLSRR